MTARPDFEALFAVLPSPYMVLDRDLRYVAANQAYLAVTDRRWDELDGRPLFESFPNEEEGGRRLKASIDRVFETGEPDTIDVLPYAIPRSPARGGGFEMRYWSVVHLPLLDEQGEVAYLAQNTVDVTEHIHVEEQQKLLIGELNHRVKNTLATVQSIAAQTFRTKTDMESCRSAFESRLMALSATHDLLTASAWRGAHLSDVAERELRPYGQERYNLEGPEVELTPGQALALGLMFHELTTNAAKHGALSTPEGCVQVRWRIDGEGPTERLAICWEETGGPAVTTPARRGFGSRLIDRALKEEAGGEARLEFKPAGVVCEMSAPLRGPKADSRETGSEQLELELTPAPRGPRRL